MNSAKIGKRWLRWGGLGGLALALSGCEAQVGPEYAGEPLMSVRGQVVLAGDNPADVTPVIAFNTATGYATVNAEVSGEFPAEFRIDVVEPPPADALYDLPDGPGQIALGILALASRDHSDRIPRFSRSQEDVCDEDGLNCTREVQKCVAEGGCITRTLTCTTELCPVVYASGDARVAEDVHATPTVQRVESLGDVAFATQESCNASLGCYRTIRRCDLLSAGPHSTVWTSGSLDRCELVSETSDSDVVLRDLLEHVAIGYAVVYLTHAQELSSYGRLARGYHLFQALEVDEADRIAGVNCELDARIMAVDAYNEANGTDYLPYDHDGDAVEAEIAARTAELAASCPPVETWRLVESPLAEDLTFVIGSDNRSLL